MSVERAIEIAVGMARPITGVEKVALRFARGRILAADLHAPRAMPAFDNSAMDGFAVRLQDIPGTGPWRLPVAGTIAAGADLRAAGAVVGAALRIFTGAPVPALCDALVMQEDCDDQGEHVRIFNRPAMGENIRRAGEDIGAGALLASRGTIIEARHVGLLAGNGHASVQVRRRPRIGVLSTGDELVDAGKGSARIHDANRPMLLALCEGLGAEVTDLGICADDLGAITGLLRANATQFDMILTSGAASVGGRDFVRPALKAAGGSVEACRVALKPGKPVFFGRLGNALLTGLPGNPLSAYVGFQLFVARQIAAMLGFSRAGMSVEKAVAGFGWKRKPGRAEYLPARIVAHDASGRPIVERLGHGGAASLMPLSQADGVAVLDASSIEGACGTPIHWFPFCRREFAWRSI
jgi:molybdopterin molybdotransferase